MKPLYFDYNATTPVDPRVLEKMLPYFQQHFGNAASEIHQWGWAAGAAVRKAREQVAELIKAKSNEIYFTSGATESNNLAIFGLIRKIREQEGSDAKIHVVSSQVEHPSVALTLQQAAKLEDVEIDFAPVDREGRVCLEEIKKLIRPHTRLISVIWVQNEIGTIQNIHDIASFAHEKKIYFHSDATQAVGKIDVDLEKTPIDLLSASSHKMYGPKGVGFLYCRSQNPKVALEALLFGGGQEHALRSGTLNVPGIVGLGMAAEICTQELVDEKSRCEELRDLLWKLLQEKIPGVQLNGPVKDRSPINLSITFTQDSLQNMLALLPQLGASVGSACHGGSWSASPILQAIQLSEAEAQSTLRLSLGRWTSREDVIQAVEMIEKAKKFQ